jgi:hypothetical protein
MVDGICNSSVPHQSPLTGFAAIQRGNATAMVSPPRSIVSVQWCTPMRFSDFLQMAAIVEHGSVIAIMQILNGSVSLAWRCLYQKLGSVSMLFLWDAGQIFCTFTTAFTVTRLALVLC